MPDPAHAPLAGPPLDAARVVIRPVRGRLILSLSWAYAGVVLAALGLIHGVGDAWWGVALLLFMPRWLFLAPLGALAVVSGLRRCPSHWWLQGAAALVVAGPLMGASLPLPRLWEKPPLGEVIRVATFNMGHESRRPAELKRWIERNRLDVVCFQERGNDDRRHPPELPEGWYLSPNVMIATRLPVVAEYPPLPSESRPGWLYSAYLDRVRVRGRSGREFLIASVHMPTQRTGIEGLFQKGDVAGVNRHMAWWGREMGRVVTTLAGSSDVPLILAGDFNMPADDSTMAALRLSFRFAFEEAGWGHGYTRPARLPWVRIDHVLTSPEWHVSTCRVGPDLGSDHLPLCATLVLPTARASAVGRPVR